MDTEEKRRRYYTYDVAKESTLFHHEAPSLDISKYNMELIELAGKDKYGDQRLRVIWAGNLGKRVYYEDGNDNFQPYWGKKYPFMRIKRPSGCVYLDNKGIETLVTHPSKVPDGKPFVTTVKREDLGTMKYAVEFKYTLEELVKMGYYLEDPKEFEKSAYLGGIKKRGRKFRELPDARGEYLLCFFIETFDKQYKDMTDQDMEAIRMVWKRALTESDRAYAGRKTKEIKEILDAEDENEDAQLNKYLGQAIIRAEKASVGKRTFDLGGK